MKKERVIYKHRGGVVEFRRNLAEQSFTLIIDGVDYSARRGVLELHVIGGEPVTVVVMEEKPDGAIEAESE